MELTIQQLADEADISRSAIKYYEREGLIAIADRNDANYRIFNETALDRIKLIKVLQKIGFKISEIKVMMNQDQPINLTDLIHNKLSETKKELVAKNSQKDYLEEIVRNWPKDMPAEVETFLEFARHQKIAPSTELIFCKHSYIKDVGRWHITGNFTNKQIGTVGMTGSVWINYDDLKNLWNVRRELVLLDTDNTVETINFFIQPAHQDGETQKFAADCSVFGDVLGDISFAGAQIFKKYEMQDHQVHGCEFLRRISPTLYEAYGMLKQNDGDQLAHWGYEMERVVETL